MSAILATPKDFIFRAMRDFRAHNPNAPFMPTKILAEQLKISEDQLEEMLKQLHDVGMIELHPMWPAVREAYITEYI
jgi:DNA-binding IscR family transcriptional regulator